MYSESTDSTPTKLPHIFVLDLDNTIIGDIKPQVMLWEISKASSKAAPIRFDVKSFQQKLLQGLIIRPGFYDFVKYIQSMDYLLYVYTASEKTWANFVISHIEKALNIRFQRPIFTRKNCTYQNGSFKKNTRNILPIIMKSLKVPKKTLSHQVPRMTIIDNLNVYHAIDQSNLVICPSYNMMHPENIGAYISPHQFKENQSAINATLHKYIDNYHPTSDYWTFQKRMSVFYVHTINDMSKHHQSDSFYPVLTTFMKSHPKHKFAKYINRHLIRK